MNWQDVLDLLAQGENQHTEFIGQAVEAVELAQIMVGLANAEGGQIILGLDDKNRYFLGTPLTRDFIEKINEQLCRPPISLLIETIEKDNKNLIVITISGANQKPYSCEDIYYLREEAETQQASFEEIQRFHGAPFVPPMKPPRPQDRPKATITEGRPATPPKPDQPGTGAALFEETAVKTSSELNERQSKLFEFLKNQPAITNRQYRLLYEVSHKTAHLELTDLVDRGRLKIEGAGRSTHYVSTNRPADNSPPLNLLTERSKPTGQSDQPAEVKMPRPRAKKKFVQPADVPAAEAKVEPVVTAVSAPETEEPVLGQAEMFPTFPKVFHKKNKPAKSAPPLPDNYLD